jgi:signal peptidase II
VRTFLAGPYVRAGIVMVIVLALDQLSKHLVSSSIVPGEEVKVLPGIQLVDARNHGVAFGLAAGSQLAVTILVCVALIALLAYFVTHSSRPLVWLPTGLLLGGALGNLLDRIRDGSVVDFIKLPLGWPPFNLADTAIVLGAALLLLVIEMPRERRIGTAQDRNGAGRT